MRYDTPVFFVKEPDKHYDPVAGEWIQGEPVRTKKYANVTHMGAERQQAVFGDYKKQRKVVRLLHPYMKQWDYLYLDGDPNTKYQFASNTALRQKQSLIVEEVK